MATMRTMETVWSFYGPWLNLMLGVGIPMLLIGTLGIFLFERGRFARWLTGRVALLGWALVLLSIGGRIIIGILQNAFTILTGT